MEQIIDGTSTGIKKSAQNTHEIYPNQSVTEEKVVGILQQLKGTPRTSQLRHQQRDYQSKGATLHNSRQQRGIGRIGFNKEGFNLESLDLYITRK